MLLKLVSKQFGKLGLLSCALLCMSQMLFAERTTAEIQIRGNKFKLLHELPARATPILPDLSRSDTTPLPARARFFVDTPLLAGEIIIDPGVYQISLIVDQDGYVFVGLSSSHLRKKYRVEANRADFESPIDGLQLSLGMHTRSKAYNKDFKEYLHLNIRWGAVLFSSVFSPINPNSSARLGWKLNSFDFPSESLNQEKLFLGTLMQEKPGTGKRKLQITLNKKPSGYFLRFEDQEVQQLILTRNELQVSLAKARGSSSTAPTTSELWKLESKLQGTERKIRHLQKRKQQTECKAKSYAIGKFKSPGQKISLQERDKKLYLQILLKTGLIEFEIPQQITETRTP